MNTEDFIKKAKEIHGDRYDYSMAKYVGCKDKLIIICPEHGEFSQRADIHLNGSICPKCADKLRVNKRKNDALLKFLKLSAKKYNDKFDYSKVEFRNTREKVCIICPEHGEIWQTPHRHLHSEYGCEKCGRKLQGRRPKLSNDEFIKKANKIHNNKYDYSKVEYINAQTKICIICPEHGEFWQKANNHLKGAGCPKCHNKYSGSRNGKMLPDVFIEKAKNVHGSKYDYSKTEYVDSLKKVCIICPEHGEFWQKPGSHLNGNGCPKCSIEKTHLKQKLSKEDFIKKSKETHGDKYDYSKVEYIDSKTKVCIICPEHSEFWQAPSNHINGQGCPICSESHLERDTAKQLKNANIMYEREKNWKWLKNIKPLHVDFYLPFYNIVIECQGKQHFEGCSFGSKNISNDKAYKYVKLIDNIKHKLCEEHNIPIEYINYNDNVEFRINEIIDKYINKEKTIETPAVNIDQ